jgi:D-alanyl-D-alanine carboxypeptidase
MVNLQRSAPIFCPLTGRKFLTVHAVLPKSVAAPVRSGDAVGYAEYEVDGKTIGRADIIATEDVARIGFWELIYRLFANMVGAFE